MDLTREQLLDAYRRMRMIREFEEKLSALVAGGKLGGFLHLYIGEEAVAVGVCAHLTYRDMVASTHRGHGHCARLSGRLELVELLALRDVERRSRLRDRGGVRLAELSARGDDLAGFDLSGVQELGRSGAARSTVAVVVPVDALGHEPSSEWEGEISRAPVASRPELTLRHRNRIAIPVP